MQFTLIYAAGCESSDPPLRVVSAFHFLYQSRKLATTTMFVRAIYRAFVDTVNKKLLNK